MRAYLVATLLAAVATPQIASAQTDATFRGIRVEGDVGWDRFRSDGTSNSKLGYGGTIGFDGMIGDRIVIGAEGSYWRPDKHSDNCTALSGGALCQRSERELGAAVRVGYLVTPALLVFGKGGYANNQQRNSFLSSSGLYYVNGNIVGPGFSASQKYSVGGYQVGGGVEYSLSRLFYVSGQFVYSRYDNRTSRQRALFGAGIRFK